MRLLPLILLAVLVPIVVLGIDYVPRRRWPAA